MDDNNFDDLLKHKLENYEDPDFDSGALAAFHERMVYFSPVPWYKKYRTETVVTTAFLLFTLLNSFIHWYGIDQQEPAPYITEMTTSHKVIDSLTVIIHQLKKDQKQPSIIFIDKKRDSEPSAQATSLLYPSSVKSMTEASLSSDDELHLGQVTSLPPFVYKRLLEEDVINVRDGEVYLVISDSIQRIRHRSYVYAVSNRAAVHSNDSVVSDVVKTKTLPIKLSNHLS